MKKFSLRDIVIIGMCLTIYLTSLFAANTLGLKLMPFPFNANISVALFSFPIVFIMTDVIGEVYGKRIARLFVQAGVASIILFIAYSVLSLAMPWADAALWAKEGYNSVFGISIRISLASLVAFWIATYQDVFSFFVFKKIFKDKFFWLRSNLSNLWSQLLDTVIFMVIAFVGVYDMQTMISIIVSWWLFKVAMGVVYTPLSYGGVWIINKLRTYEYTSN